MKTEFLLYGLAHDETRPYMEELLASGPIAKLEAIKIIAAKDGYHSFRIAQIDLNTKPDFISAINC